MAIRKIVYIGDPVLHRQAQAVTEFNDELRALIDDMFETMYDARGCGLAAPQIGISLQLAVLDNSEDKSGQMVLVNPQIITAEGEELMTAGCLSIPGVYDAVKRSTRVTVRAFDAHGKSFEFSAEGHLAHIFQHEIDHLHGKVFIDRLSILKRNRARKQHEKYLRTKKRQSSSEKN